MPRKRVEGHHYRPDGLLKGTIQAGIGPGQEYKEIKEDTTFHIGQSYEKIAVISLECGCGSREFNVGQGSFYTVIRCPKCKWEAAIHDG